MKRRGISISDYMLLQKQISIAHSNITEALESDVLAK
jgi:hypothetical protein